MPQRLDRMLSEAGEGSRSETSRLIRSGLVCVNGVRVDRPEYKLEPDACTVTLDGRPVLWTRFRHVMLNKPAGVLSATEDGRDKTALDLLPPLYAKLGLSPAGRLDKDAEGLLFLTNDGQLAHRLISPRCHIEKVYHVRLAEPVRPEYTDAFSGGMTLGDGTVCMPGKLVILDEYLCEVTILEGKYHQIKRMFASLGNAVTYLKRIKIATLTLDNELIPGEYRELYNNEIEILYQATAQASK